MRDVAEKFTNGAGVCRYKIIREQEVVYMCARVC